MGYRTSICASHDAYADVGHRLPASATGSAPWPVIADRRHCAGDRCPGSSFESPRNTQAGVRSKHCVRIARILRNRNGRFLRQSIASSVTVAVEIDAFRFAAATVPPEDQPPLTVDADRVEPRQITVQLLEVIARRYPQVLIARSNGRMLLPAAKRQRPGFPEKPGEPKLFLIRAIPQP